MWIRLLGWLLAAVFAMPACMTLTVWEPDRGLQYPSAGAQSGSVWFVAADAGGPALVVDTTAPGAAAFLPFAPGRTPPHRWLWVTPTEHGETLSRLQAMFPDGHAPLFPSLQRLLPFAGLPQRDQLSLGVMMYPRPSSPIPDELWQLHELRSYRSVYGKYHDLVVPCALTWRDDPPAGGQPWALGELRTEVGKPVVTSTGKRLLQTPFALLGDLLLSPFELLAIGTWW